ncbi:MAG: M16 family metallopeptidase [Gammaproteobacteria bacterium]|nr:pitrilysin family protein [Gammaproteobacteria bacterium]
MTDTQFQNGTRIIVQRRPGAASAAVVIALVHGSRHPLPEHAGLPHLLEHLLFRSAAAAGAEGGGPYHAFEAAGGECNASVGRELTLLEGLVPAGRAIGLLRAFVAGLQCLDGSTLALQNECEAIARESEGSTSGTDTDMEQQALAGSLGNHGLARAPEGVGSSALSVASVQAYWRELLHGSRLCIAVVGDVDEREVVRVSRPLAGLPAGAPIRPSAPAFRAGRLELTHAERCGQVLWLMPAPAAGAPGFIASLAANHILGGGLTSRMYRALRTEAGWCYHVASRLEHYSDAGLWWIDARTVPEVLDVCAVRLAHEVHRLAASGPQPAEIALARDYLTARLCLEEDHPASCARRLARDALYLGAPRPVASYRDAIAALSATEVQEIVAHGLEHRFEVVGTPLAGARQPASGTPTPEPGLFVRGRSAAHGGSDQ